jgi:Putative DNA-binding domain
MKLARLQNAFQDGVLLGDSAISRSILDSRRLDRAARFKIYFDAYRFRLAEFLSNDYPVLRSFLGDELFGLLVEAYVEAMPSHYPNARDYGGVLPNFMRLTAPWSEGRDAIDLARLERALSAAFDAADGPVLAVGCLADISVEDWPHLAFRFHPSWLCSMSRRGPSSVMPRFPQTQAGSTSRGKTERPSWSGAMTVRSSIAPSRPPSGWRIWKRVGERPSAIYARFWNSRTPTKNHLACRVFSRGLVPRWARLPRISRRVTRQFPGTQGARRLQNKDRHFNRQVSRYQRRRELIASSKTVSSSLLRMASRKLFQWRKPSWAPRKARANRKGTR